MLVLSRRANEQIRITVHGVEILLTQIEVRGKRSRLGFEAPTEVKIVRTEVETKEVPGQPEAANLCSRS